MSDFLVKKVASVLYWICYFSETLARHTTIRDLKAIHPRCVNRTKKQSVNITYILKNINATCFGCINSYHRAVQNKIKSAEVHLQSTAKALIFSVIHTYSWYKLCDLIQNELHIHLKRVYIKTQYDVAVCDVG